MRFRLAFALTLAPSLAGCPKPAAAVPEPAPAAAPAEPWVVGSAADLAPGRSGAATVVGTLEPDGLRVGEVLLRVDAGGADWSWMVGTRIRVMGTLAADGDGWHLTARGSPLPADEP